jgi:hypothetical protein
MSHHDHHHSPLEEGLEFSALESLLEQEGMLSHDTDEPEEEEKSSDASSSSSSSSSMLNAEQAAKEMVHEVCFVLARAIDSCLDTRSQDLNASMRCSARAVPDLAFCLLQQDKTQATCERSRNGQRRWLRPML